MLQIKGNNHKKAERFDVFIPLILFVISCLRASMEVRSSFVINSFSLAVDACLKKKKQNKKQKQKKRIHVFGLE